MSPAELAALSAADLALALAAHPRWEWRAGMRPIVPGRPRSAWRLYLISDGGAKWLAATGDGEAGGFVSSWAAYEEASRAYSAYAIDLDDAASAGLLLVMLVAELGRWPMALCALLDDDIEATVLDGGALRGELPTLGVALARALLAAWGPP